MKRPPKKPPSAVNRSDEDTLEFEGIPGGKRRDTGAHRVVPPSESEIGGVEHDERGHARWTWKADLASSADPTAETFNYLKSLETDLEIERSQQVRALEQSTKTGMNPYDTGRLKKPK